MFTSAFPARRNATRISSSDTAADLISPARGNPTATRWNTVENSNFIIRRSSDRPRSHIAAARPRASSTPRMAFTPAMRYDLLVFLQLDVGGHARYRLVRETMRQYPRYLHTLQRKAIRLQNTPKNYVNRWFPGYSKNFSPVESRLISKLLFRHKFSPFSYDLKSEKAATQARLRSRGPNIAEQCRLQSTIRAEHCRSVPIE